MPAYLSITTLHIAVVHHTSSYVNNVVSQLDLLGISLENWLAVLLFELTGGKFRASFEVITMRKRSFGNSSDLTPLLGSMLRAAYTFRHLDVHQFMQILGYGPHSLSRCQGNLTCLFDAKFLYRHTIPHRSAGWVPFVYCLGKQSLKYLDGCGFDVDFRFREWEHKQYSFP